ELLADLVLERLLDIGLGDRASLEQDAPDEASGLGPFAKGRFELLGIETSGPHEDLADARRLRLAVREEADDAVFEIDMFPRCPRNRRRERQRAGMLVDGERLEDLAETEAGQVALEHEWCLNLGPRSDPRERTVAVTGRPPRRRNGLFVASRRRRSRRVASCLRRRRIPRPSRAFKPSGNQHLKIR